MEQRTMPGAAGPALGGRRKHKSGVLAGGTGKALLCLGGFCLFFSVFCVPMGLANALNTMMNTAYRLLIDTTLYIMALAVVAGAVSSLLGEFGVVELLNRLLSPLMKPLYGLPGAAALGIVTTFLSDNPAILTLADDPQYRRYFKAYQIPALTNLGTAFGMGLIVTAFMLGKSKSMGQPLGLAVLCGNIGAVLGSIVSTRLMLEHTAKVFGREAGAEALLKPAGDGWDACLSTEAPSGLKRPGEGEKEGKRGAMAVMEALTRGGRKGVELGLGIIPGVLIICTVVMMLTKGPSAEGYTGAAYEGIGLLPLLAGKIDFLLKPLFGFSSAACAAVPVTALGSAGASLGVVDTLIASGSVTAGDIGVFTAMCMCWSGYLSTHVSMMDVLHCSGLTGKAILFHTVGGLTAGVAAHWLYALLCALA